MDVTFEADLAFPLLKQNQTADMQINLKQSTQLTDGAFESFLK